MHTPKNPTERSAKKRTHPEPKTRSQKTDQDRTLPGRRSPANEKQRERIVNEDEQLKVVNNREDNAQSSGPPPGGENQNTAAHESDNERLEAGYDNSEWNPRPPKVN